MDGQFFSQAIEFQISRGACGTHTEDHVLSVNRDLQTVLLFAWSGRVPVHTIERQGSTETKSTLILPGTPEAIEEAARANAASTKMTASMPTRSK
jgi:hypothetical protein